MYRILIFSIAIILTACGKEAFTDIELYNSNHEFKELYDNYLENSNAGWENNLQGRFRWDDTYALHSITLMYEKTKDPYFIEIGCRLVKKLFTSTDDDLGFLDEIRKIQGNSWSSTRYSNGKKYSWNVHTTFILYETLYFLRIIKFKNCIGDISLTNLILEKIEIIDRELDKEFNIINNQAYYNEPYLIQTSFNEIPLNFVAINGLYTLEQYRFTKNPKYLQRLHLIKNFITSSIVYKEDYLIWPYSKNPKEDLNSSISNPDDISHGSFVVKFIVETSEELNLFSPIIVEKIENLLLNNILEGNNKLNYFLDNTFDNRKVDFIIPFWLDLPNKEIKKTLKSILKQFNKQVIPDYDFNHLGSEMLPPYSYLYE